MNDVPEIHIACQDPALLEKIKLAVLTCCARKNWGPEHIDQILSSGENSLTLTLNFGEGAYLCEGDPLLFKELGLFNGNPANTKAQEQQHNGENARRGIEMRLPSLEDGFRVLAYEAEKIFVHMRTLPPPTPQRFKDVVAGNDITVVGELHGQESPKLAVESILPLMPAGQSALVLEGIPANRQGLLDEWQRGGPLHPLLRANLMMAGGEKGCGYYERLLNAARAACVKVMAFDSDAALAINYSNTRTPEEAENNIQREVAERIAKEGSTGSPEAVEEALLRKKAANTIDGSDTMPLQDIKSLRRQKQKNDFEQSAALAKTAGGRDPLDYRLTTGNMLAAACIEQCKKDGYSKIVALVGAAHAIEENGIPGVGDMVRAPQLVIEDATAGHADGKGKVINDAPPGIRRGEYLKITVEPDVQRQELDNIVSAGIKDRVAAIASAYKAPAVSTEPGEPAHGLAIGSLRPEREMGK